MLEILCFKLGTHENIKGNSRQHDETACVTTWTSPTTIFRNNKNKHRSFFSIISSRHKPTSILRCDETPRLACRYLPRIWRQSSVKCNTNLFHIYSGWCTHTTVGKFTSLMAAEYKQKFPISSTSHTQYPKSRLSVIAGLYHDIAKGRGGWPFWIRFAFDAQPSLNVTDYQKQDHWTCVWLVRNQPINKCLLQPQRKDISDPEVNLGNSPATSRTRAFRLSIFILTVADINATNPTCGTVGGIAYASAIFRNKAAHCVEA